MNTYFGRCLSWTEKVSLFVNDKPSFLFFFELKCDYVILKGELPLVSIFDLDYFSVFDENLPRASHTAFG